MTTSKIAGESHRKHTTAGWQSRRASYRMALSQWRMGMCSVTSLMRDISMICAIHKDSLYTSFFTASQLSGDDDSTEVAFHRRSPAPIPAVLPRKIWDEKLYQKRLGQFHRDLKFWNLMHSHLMKKASNPDNPYGLVRNKLGQLLIDGKIKEAECYYKEIEWDQDSMAECWLALIHSTGSALGFKKEKELADTRMWFFVDQNDRRRGPILENSLMNLFDAGRLWPDTPVWTQGMRDWASAATTKRFRQGPLYTGPLPPRIS